MSKETGIGGFECLAAIDLGPSNDITLFALLSILYALSQSRPFKDSLKGHDCSDHQDRATSSLNQ